MCYDNMFVINFLVLDVLILNLLLIFAPRIPNVTMTKDEGGVELDISDDPFDFKRLDVSGAPVIVTVNKVAFFFLCL